MTKKMSKKIIVWVAVLSLMSLTAACGKDSKQSSSKDQRGRPGARSGVLFPVEVEQVKARALIYSVTAVGSVEAFEKVQVTARVSGAVDRVLFTEGSFARVDQVLVEIETERYRLAVEAAEAALTKAEASKADAEAGLKRRESVVTQTPGLIPGEEIETWRTKVSVAAAEVSQAKSALDQAKLNLRDAYVRAPFSGIIQTRTVQTGQYVQTGTVLATLVRRDPLLVRFSVPERDAARLRPGMKASFKVRDDQREFRAKIASVAEAADEGTRLVAISGKVDDPKERNLRPGSFAEITVPVNTLVKAIVIPQTAVRPTERGFVSYVVENGAAAERILTLGMRTADGQVEVLSGLEPGEMLVVRGAEALRNGAPVKTEEPPAPEQNRKSDSTKVGKRDPESP